MVSKLFIQKIGKRYSFRGKGFDRTVQESVYVILLQLNDGILTIGG